ncbi:MAG: hypothetical protein ACXU9U_05485 [Parachlamydiaceae bacterium]
MGKELISKERNAENQIEKRKAAVKFVDQQFNVSQTVNHLQKLMTEVTKDRITADTVNAACNCVQNLNLTIKTAMQAARFVSNTARDMNED